MNLMETIQVLVVDDEKMIRNLLKMSLQRLGYEVTTATDGIEGIQRFREGTYHLVLLDILMPGLDGFDVCTELRKISDVPIVMLTALNRPDDVVRGLELGADNYITKPFTFKEVEARIRAILRRTALRTDTHSFQVLEEGDVKLDSGMRAATVAGQLVELTPIEYDLLYYLMIHPDRPVSKEELLRDVWSYEATEANSNIVELAIRRLRKKIEQNPSNPRRLITQRGVGYKFVSFKSHKLHAADLPRHRRHTQNAEDETLETTASKASETTNEPKHADSATDSNAYTSDVDDELSEILEQILDDVEMDDR